jgi:gluconokinase
MPTSLLDSQLAALEPLSADERGIVLDATRDPAELVREATAALAQVDPA